MKFISRLYHTRLIPPSQFLCKNCKYFIADKKECGNFVHTNLVTGQKIYETASFARTLESNCGKYGKHFEYNIFKAVTGPYYFVKEMWPYLLLPTIGIVGLFVGNKS